MSISHVSTLVCLCIFRSRRRLLRHVIHPKTTPLKLVLLSGRLAEVRAAGADAGCHDADHRETDRDVFQKMYFKAWHVGTQHDAILYSVVQPLMRTNKSPHLSLCLS